MATLARWSGDEWLRLAVLPSLQQVEGASRVWRVFEPVE